MSDLERAGVQWSPTRTLIPLLVGLAVVTVAGWAFGLEWAPALLVGLTVVALLGLRQLPHTNHDEDWPAAVDSGSDRGVRREVARLSWSLQGHESRVERSSVVRLRGVADRRLARHGLHLDDPADADACAALLGPTAYRTLTSGPRDQVRFEQFAASIGPVEKLTLPRGAAP